MKDSSGLGYDSESEIVKNNWLLMYFSILETWRYPGMLDMGPKEEKKSAVRIWTLSI